MTIAVRKGKLSLRFDSDSQDESYWKRIEDFLTADVFGAYRYVPPAFGVMSLLGHAHDENFRPFYDYLRERGVSPDSVDVARIRLWPRLDDGKEPDAVISLGRADNPHLVLILVEAKLHSPQHPIGECSQIGHYLTLHMERRFSDERLSSITTEIRPLLYVTAHTDPPREEMSQARAEVQQGLPNRAADDIAVFWVPWRKAGEEAKQIWERERKGVAEKPWLRVLLDLTQDLKARDLMPRPPFARMEPAVVAFREWTFGRSYADAKPNVVAASPPYSNRNLRINTGHPMVRPTTMTNRRQVPPYPWLQIPQTPFSRETNDDD